MAAIRHARYLTVTEGGDRTHDPSPHVETPNAPNYSGKTPTDRADAAGYLGGDTWEDLTGYIVAGGLGAARAKAYAVQSLFDAPYHRIPFLRADVRDFGVGVSEGLFGHTPAPDGSVPISLQRQMAQAVRGFVVLDFGSRRPSVAAPASDAQPVVYPVAGQSDVPLAWLPDEDPDPLRMHRAEIARKAWGDRAVGYVVTYLAPDGALQVLSAQLTTAAGQAVPCYVNTPENDDAIHGVLLIPKQPLAPATAYTASVQATGADGRDISRRWSFTTARDVRKSMTRNVLQPVQSVQQRTSDDPGGGAVAGRLRTAPQDRYPQAGSTGGQSWPGR
jgi:hypothetical protein